MVGQIGFFAELFVPSVSPYILIAIIFLPVALVIFCQPNEMSNIWVRRIHVFSAVWYVCITFAVELSGFFGYAPAWAMFFRILVHLGWLQFAPLLKK